MMLLNKLFRIAAVGLLMANLSAQSAQAVDCRVFVVMSYEEQLGWVKDQQEGIDAVLAKTCQVEYFYLNARSNPDGLEQKAKEAFARYQEWQPTGVIAADDDAQKVFVVPYLKDKVATPVMFCAVNREPQQYGYPSSNVSGILEVTHLAESLAFVQQLLPSVNTFSAMQKDGAAAQLNLKTFQEQGATFSAQFVEMKMPKTLDDAIAMSKELQAASDALIIFTFGFINADGAPIPEKEAVAAISAAFGKPVLGMSEEYLRYQGVLCSVVKSAQEQGETAAKMLLKAMQGTPVSELPITQNHHGKRIINVTTMKAFGITPPPSALRGAQLVTTAP